MIQKPLDAITAEVVKALVDNGLREGKTVEYKLKLPGRSDGDKKEFLADVSSFANAAGGDLVFGVEAKDGIPIAIPGLSGFNEDSDRLRLESSIRDGISPRLPGVQLRAVEGFNDASVLIVRIPRSWAGPHMVTFKGSSRFFSRNSAGKFPMDVTEIRAAFDASAELPERIGRWRDTRVGRIVANEGPVRLSSSSCLVVHLIPFESLANPWRFHAEELVSKSADLAPLGAHGWDHRINVDGLLTFLRYGDTEDQVTKYTQLFRSASIEAVNARLIVEREGTRYIGSLSYEREVLQAVRSYLKALQDLQIQPPVAFFLSLLGAKGAYMFLKPPHQVWQPYPIDRDVLHVPDVLIEDFACDLPQVLRPAFDAVWNACGLSGSRNYDENRKWCPE